MFYKAYHGYRFTSVSEFSFPKRIPTFKNPSYFRHFLILIGCIGLTSFSKALFTNLYNAKYWEELYKKEKKKTETLEFFIGATNIPSTNPLSRFSQF